MNKLQYTISEVSTILEEPISCVRYWSNAFPKFVKPERNAKGNRLYSRGDVDNLVRIKHLVQIDGLTLDGAAKQLEADTAKLDKSIRVLASLKAVREQLADLRKLL